MTPARYQYLILNWDAKLSPEEIAKGWHWCAECDGLPVGPGMAELRSCEMCIEGELWKRLVGELKPETQLTNWRL